MLDSAESLASQLNRNVSTSQYEVLAGEKEQDQEFEKAKEYHLSAVQAARDRTARATAYRSLGALSLRPSNQDPEVARRYFEAAISTLGNDQDDLTNYALGYTYYLWAYAERSAGITDNVNEHAKKAREYFTAISPSNPLRETALSSITYLLEDAKN